MKKLLIILSCFGLFVTLTFAGQDSEYYGYSYARLSYVKGDVFIQRAGDLGFEEGLVNFPLVEGEKVGTRDGRTEIHFGKKNYLRIDKFTQLELVNLPRRGLDKIQINLLSGNVFLRVNFLEREKDFEIHTPDASFYILDVGLYRLAVQENRDTELVVLEGAAEAAGEEGSVPVERTEKLIVANGYFQEGPSYHYANFEDSFSQWNTSRDALHNRNVSRRYLPSELYEYESELDYHGRWFYERPYGYVWVPYVYHTVWRPYHYGRWVWLPFVGWNWVSYEPWGWCVYHYGRWHWRVGLGWYWIPTRAWGPAWVHWYHGYDYVGWCPVSYYGHPVVLINNHFYGRYYDSYYPHHSRALTVVHKNQLQARRISQVALSQNQVSRLSKISLTARQPDIRPAINKTALQDTKAAKVFSGANVRQIGKRYLSSNGGFRSSSRTSSIKSKGASRSSLYANNLGKSTQRLQKVRSPSDSKILAQDLSRKGSPKSTKARSNERTSRNFARSEQSRSTIKTYSSKQTTSSRSVSSLSIKQRNISPQKSPGATTRVRSSSQAIVSKSAVKNYRSNGSFTTPQNRRPATTQDFKNSSRSQISKYRSKYVQSNSAPSRNPLRSKSSVSNRSTPRRSVSLSRSSSPPRQSVKSSRSGTTRSKPISSRSSSSKKVKK